MNDQVTPEQNNLEKRGKTHLLLLFAGAMLFTVVVIISYNVMHDSDRVLAQLFRIFALIFLMTMTFEGKRWAKWLLVGYFIYSSLSVLKNNSFSVTDHWFVFVYYGLGIYHALATILLIYSPSISRYLDSKRVK
jgi:hypothetical protein